MRGFFDELLGVDVTVALRVGVGLEGMRLLEVTMSITSGML